MYGLYHDGVVERCNAINAEIHRLIETIACFDKSMEEVRQKIEAEADVLNATVFRIRKIAASMPVEIDD